MGQASDQTKLRVWADALLNNPQFDLGKIVDRHELDITNVLAHIDQIQVKFPELFKGFQHIEVRRIPSEDYDNYADGGAVIKIYCETDEEAEELLASETVWKEINYIYDSRPHRIAARIINGWQVPNLEKNQTKANQLSDACKAYLKLHPKTRKFEIIGPEEDRNLEKPHA